MTTGIRRRNAGAFVVSALVVLGGCHLGQPPTVYSAGGQDVASGDLDGDGDQDLVPGTFGPLAPLMNDGTGAMTYRHPSVTAPNVVQLALGDIDEDGDLDGVALVDDNSSFAPGVYTLLGRGDGSFDPPVLLSPEPVVGPGWAMGWDVDLADLNRDGHLDMVTADFLVGVTIRSGLGTGAFAEPVSHDIGDRLDTNELLTDDLDADGDTDLVLAGAADVGDGLRPSVMTLTNDGTGTLAAPVVETLPGTGIVRDVAVTDLNGDGDVDLVAVEPLARTVTALLGDGAGAFPARVVTPTPDRGVAAVDTADMDGDHHVDAVVGVAGSSDGLVLFGDGTGGFPDQHVVHHGHDGVWEILVEDLDTDGRPDITFVAVGTTTTLMNRLNGRPHH